MDLTQELSRPTRISPHDMERMARNYRNQMLGEHIADAIVAVIQGYRRLRAAYLRWEERQHTIAELERLDNRCLADIGIEREEIETFAAGHLARHDADEHLYVAGTVPALAANAPAADRKRLVVAA